MYTVVPNFTAVTYIYRSICIADITKNFLVHEDVEVLRDYPDGGIVDCPFFIVKSSPSLAFSLY